MDWHRLFALILTDYFAGSPFGVDAERDLSVQQQFLDILIYRRKPGALAGLPPDGFDDLASHNLITFKSHREALDDWALKELTSHYVTYRKVVSPSPRQLLPEEEFRLYAVSARFPHNLAGQVSWEEVKPGVFLCRRGTDAIRVVVLPNHPLDEHNALLHLFSAVPGHVAYGAKSYRVRAPNTSTLLYQLFQGYRGEGLIVPYTMRDFRRDFRTQFFNELTPEEKQEVLGTLSPEERLKGLPPEELLKGLPPEERLRGLPPEERLRGLPPEELLKGLSPENLRAIKTYLERLEDEGA